MSKASEWAKRKPADLHVGNSLVYVDSDDNGDPMLRIDNVAMSPDQAMTLARWILDTFGESA